MTKLVSKFLATKDLEHVWTTTDSDDGRVALVGYGRDEAQLLQINLEKKEIEEYYYLPGKYPLCILIIDNSIAIVGTNDSSITLIDLNRKERFASKKIFNSDISIKKVQYSKFYNSLFIITKESLVVVDYKNLDILCTYDLDFNPWDIVIIPGSDLVAVVGSSVKIELYKYDQSNFQRISSFSHGSKNRDMTSIAYSQKYSWLLSTSETGFLYFWDVTENGLTERGKIPFKDELLYYSQSIDQFVVFSGSISGASLVDFQEKEIIKIPESKCEGEVKLRKLNDVVYVLYLGKDGGLGVSDLTNNNLKALSLDNNLPERFSKIAFTSQGSIIGVTKSGILLANINASVDLNKESKPKGIKVECGNVEEYFFDEANDKLLLQLKDKSLHIIDLVSSTVSNLEPGLDLKIKTMYLSLKNFNGDDALLMDWEGVYHLDIKKSSVLRVLDFDDIGAPADKLKIIDKDSFAVINKHDYMADPIIYKMLKVFNLNGDLIKEKDLGSTSNAFFSDSNYLITTDMQDPSTLVNLKGNESRTFDIGYVFSENDCTSISNCLSYCLRIAIGNQFKYYMTFYNLSETNGEGFARTEWQVEDPSLENFLPLGFCQMNQLFYIIDKISGTAYSICSESGDVVDSYLFQEGIDDIKMSMSGKYIAWKLKTGEFYHSLYPFSSLKHDS